MLKTMIWYLALPVAFALTSAVQAMPLAPHHAEYDVHLLKADSRGGVQGVRGQLLYTFRDLCDAWAIESEMSLTISFPTAAQQSRRAMTLSEAKDGSVATFVVTEQDGPAGASPNRLTVSETVRGRADVNASRSELTVSTSDAALPLPADIIFSTPHLQELIEAAKAGRKFVSRVVLDPSLEDHVAVVSAVIINEEPPTDAGLPQWNMRLAFFPAGAADSSEPDYELAMVMAEDGVVTSFTQYVGALAVEGELTDLERLDTPDC